MYRDMVITNICHFYHCSCFTAGEQIVPEGVCRAVFCLMDNTPETCKVAGMSPTINRSQPVVSTGTYAAGT